MSTRLATLARPRVIAAFHDAAACARMTYAPVPDSELPISKISLGCSAAASVFGKTDDKEAIEVIVAAARSGVTLFDTAPWYGHGKAEIILGKALESIPRSSVRVNTKVGRYCSDVRGMFDFSASRTVASMHESLDRLEIEYIDCLQSEVVCCVVRFLCGWCKLFRLVVCAVFFST
jgi:L-galactose dehydrogenase